MPDKINESLNPQQESLPPSVSNVDQLGIWPPPPAIPTNIISSQRDTPWHSVLQVLRDLVLGSLAGFGISSIVSIIVSIGIASLMLQDRTMYLLYLMHTPVYYFAARSLSKRTVFRCAFAVPCIGVVLMILWCWWFSQVIPD